MLTFVLMPGSDDMDAYTNARRDGRLDRLVELNDPARFPRLFVPENRFDFAHLNGATAHECTRLLVHEIRALDD